MAERIKKFPNVEVNAPLGVPINLGILKLTPTKSTERNNTTLGEINIHIKNFGEVVVEFNRNLGTRLRSLNEFVVEEIIDNDEDNLSSVSMEIMLTPDEIIRNNSISVWLKFFDLGKGDLLYRGQLEDEGDGHFGVYSWRDEVSVSQFHFDSEDMGWTERTSLIFLAE